MKRKLPYVTSIKLLFLAGFRSDIRRCRLYLRTHITYKCVQHFNNYVPEDTLKTTIYCSSRDLDYSSMSDFIRY